MNFNEWFEWWRAEANADYKSLYSLMQEKIHNKFLDMFCKDLFKAAHNVALHRLLEAIGDAEGISKEAIKTYIEK